MTCHQPGPWRGCAAAGGPRGRAGGAIGERMPARWGARRMRGRDNEPGGGATAQSPSAVSCYGVGGAAGGAGCCPEPEAWRGAHLPHKSIGGKIKREASSLRWPVHFHVCGRAESVYLQWRQAAPPRGSCVARTVQASWAWQPAGFRQPRTATCSCPASHHGPVEDVCTPPAATPVVLTGANCSVPQGTGHLRASGGAHVPGSQGAVSSYSPARAHGTTPSCGRCSRVEVHLEKNPPWPPHRC